MVEELDNERYKISGKIQKIDSTTVEITELPVRTWTQAYKEQLEQWLQGVPPKQPAWITVYLDRDLVVFYLKSNILFLFLQDYKEYHTDSSVHFLVSLTEQEMAKAEEEGLEKRFKISTTISTSNLVCFDKEGRIKKYENVNGILKDFYEERLKHYQARKVSRYD